MSDMLNFINDKIANPPENVADLPIEVPNCGRDDMAKMFKELGYKTGVEIGVEGGLYSRVICQENPGVRLYSIDSWKAYKNYRTYVTQEKIDEYYEKAKERLAPFDCLLIKGYSMNVIKEFKDGELDFVFIDGNHEFEYVVQDVAFWQKKVRSGGIVSGHDYIGRNKPTATHVIQALNTYTQCHDVNPWFVLGRKEKREGEIRENSRSWMWIKP